MKGNEISLCVSFVYSLKVKNLINIKKSSKGKLASLFSQVDLFKTKTKN
ncbi:hypothetical protein DB44_FL00160 [Candidatus Protochlamydia amoebophila]|uniref:Uncharacterized protein n=1 Tax=Candidatus Protochlamydia amoebophila TaxID=362787 RepID=A0A0C1JJS5_9BACT|nr:hypothetical protein DB44_FL00160 [Candidatus Protochlamydia amoebophila]